jgi:two-component system sensor kinase FixL
VVDWLVADYGDSFNEEGREQLDLLTGRVDRMHGLIEGVLRYSRAGRPGAGCTEVNLDTLLPEIIDTLAPPAHIQVSIEGPLPCLRCESTCLTQLFQNLIGNAIKYNDKAEGRVRVTCSEEDKDWHFAVIDNGCGIPRKQFGRIFDMFTTLRARDQYESTGVGLPIVKKIVESHGGRVWVESEEEQGSTFHVCWPKEPPLGSEAFPSETTETDDD